MCGDFHLKKHSGFKTSYMSFRWPHKMFLTVMKMIKYMNSAAQKYTTVFHALPNYIKLFTYGLLNTLMLHINKPETLILDCALLRDRDNDMQHTI